MGVTNLEKQAIAEDMLKEFLDKDVERIEDLTEEGEELGNDLVENIDKRKRKGFQVFADKLENDEQFKNLKLYIEEQLEMNEPIFTVQQYLKLKYKHKTLKLVIIAPTFETLNAGDGNAYYLVKPLYREEYNQFLKEFGPRDENPDTFADYAINKCVLFPYNLPKKMTCGTSNALYSTILKVSDLGSTMRVIEV